MMNYSTPAAPAPKVTWLNVVQGAATFMKETVKNEKSVWYTSDAMKHIVIL